MSAAVTKGMLASALTVLSFMAGMLMLLDGPDGMALRGVDQQHMDALREVSSHNFRHRSARRGDCGLTQRDRL